MGTKLSALDSDADCQLPFFEKAAAAHVASSEKKINSINIRITDGRNTVLDLNGLNVALSIIIEEDFEH